MLSNKSHVCGRAMKAVLQMSSVIVQFPQKSLVCGLIWSAVFEINECQH